MNALVPITGGGLPSVFQSRIGNLPDMNAAAAANLTAGFGVITYKGKVWRTRFRGEETMLLDDRNVPIPTLEVVIVGISSAIAKSYYATGFVDGSNEAPDCYSTDGIVPDPSSGKRQHDNCAACPMNRFGSRINDNGKKAKACSDSRRIAVVPSTDIMNESLGGPMLLKLPAMSLNNLMAYTKLLGQHGAQPFAVATQMRFDYNVAYPLIDFQALGWLDDAQATQVLEVLEDAQIGRILDEGDEHDPAPEAAPSPIPGQQSQVLNQAAPPPPPPPPPAPAQQAPVAAGPTGQPAAPRTGAFGAAPQPVAQAQPGPAAVPQAPAAPARAGGFGRPAAAAAAPAAAPQPAQTSVPTTVQGLPTDLAAAIDGLLDG